MKDRDRGVNKQYERVAWVDNMQTCHNDNSLHQHTNLYMLYRYINIKILTCYTVTCHSEERSTLDYIIMMCHQKYALKRQSFIF